MYIKVTGSDAENYSISKLKIDNPNVSFGETVPENTLAEYDVFEVAETESGHNPLTQEAEEGFELKDGKWTHKWTITERSDAKEAVFADCEFKVGSELDQFAKTKGYDSIATACTYNDSTVESFAAEGAKAISMRDQMWEKLYVIRAEVDAGTRALPNSYDDIKAEMPILSWN